ncbi:hypothetical protein ACFQY8_00070 [Alloscardovia venturai]|uniref:Uncharacterized protein n=1 Tax=Alloscardovia venturai TaxID=1769421 RepID=A0ABW2Y1N2_9BIFI
MGADIFRVLATVCISLAVLTFIVAVVLYYVLRIREVKRVLSGQAQSEEIESMRSARWGTWIENSDASHGDAYDDFYHRVPSPSTLQRNQQRDFSHSSSSLGSSSLANSLSAMPHSYEPQLSFVEIRDSDEEHNEDETTLAYRGIEVSVGSSRVSFDDVDEEESSDTSGSDEGATTLVSDELVKKSNILPHN